MKRRITFFMLVALVLALLAPMAWAQSGMAYVHGVVKDVKGVPVPGAVIQLINKENGRKYDNIKSDKSGEFRALGVQPGAYVLNVLKNGQTIYHIDTTRLGSGENSMDLDLSKEAARQGAGLTPEQKKALEEQDKEVNKIKGLNDKLAAAKAAQDGGNTQQAVQILTEASQIDATQPVIWVLLADAERAMAKTQADPTERKATYSRAIEDYKKAIALKPMGAYYNNMGDAMAKMGDFDAAIASYEQAATLDPPNAAMYYFNEGAVLTNSGKVDLANVAFDKAIAADPSKADAYYQKGINLLQKPTMTGNKVEYPPGTAESFKKYLELQPNGPFAEGAKAMLQQMGQEIETNYGKPKATKKK